ERAAQGGARRQVLSALLRGDGKPPRHALRRAAERRGPAGDRRARGARHRLGNGGRGSRAADRDGAPDLVRHRQSRDGRRHPRVAGGRGAPPSSQSHGRAFVPGQRQPRAPGRHLPQRHRPPARAADALFARAAPLPAPRTRHHRQLSRLRRQLGRAAPPRGPRAGDPLRHPPGRRGHAGPGHGRGAPRTAWPTSGAGRGSAGLLQGFRLPCNGDGPSRRAPRDRRRRAHARRTGAVGGRARRGPSRDAGGAGGERGVALRRRRRVRPSRHGAKRGVRPGAAGGDGCGAAGGKHADSQRCAVRVARRPDGAHRATARPRRAGRRPHPPAGRCRAARAPGPGGARAGAHRVRRGADGPRHAGPVPRSRGPTVWNPSTSEQV
ncbi:MAG: glycosyl transferase, group 1, partial [uncultured Gemmatimonadetes bacterium]